MEPRIYSSVVMRSQRICISLVSIACLLGSAAAMADSFHCGVHLIREGMPASEIAEKCGPPDSLEEVQIPIVGRRANGTTYRVGITTTAYWTYDRRSGQFPARLTIEDGLAKSIELVIRP